jgi:Zn-dependent protease
MQFTGLCLLPFIKDKGGQEFMNGNIRVGSLFGIPFYINSSWFLVLALVTFSYGSGLAQQFSNLPGYIPWLSGFVAALLLFASVLAHELGHSLVAIKQGVGVNSITLFLFGGLASLEKESKTPAEAFWVAIAGPAVSFLLFGLFLGLSTVLPLGGPLGAVIQLLAYINLVLAVFNLIPGLPLDGGNILKSLVWKITGNAYKGVIFAGRVGQIFGWVAILLASLQLFLYGNINALWAILIGFFLLQNAGSAAQSASVQNKLSRLKAADAVTPDSPIVAENLSLREFANNYVIGQKKWQKFIVTNEMGHFIGVLSVDDMKLVSTQEWPHTSVREITKLEDAKNTIQGERTLLEAVMMLEEKQLSQLTVLDEHNRVLGLLEKSYVPQFLEKRQQSQPQPADKVEETPA